MKKLVTLALVLLLAFTLAACGGSTSSSSAAPAEANTSSTPAASQDTSVSVTAPVANAGADWPDNEYTKLVPKPGFAFTCVADADGLSVVFTNVTLDEVKTYTEQVKDAGFTVNALESEADGSYSYVAENSDGYSVAISFASGVAGLVMTKA